MHMCTCAHVHMHMHFTYLQALTAQGSALAARDEPGRRQREALLRQMEELLSGLDADAAEKDVEPCSF